MVYFHGFHQFISTSTKWAKNELGIKIVPGLKMGQETKNSVLKRGYKWVQG